MHHRLLIFIYLGVACHAPALHFFESSHREKLQSFLKLGKFANKMVVNEGNTSDYGIDMSSFITTNQLMLGSFIC